MKGYMTLFVVGFFITCWLFILCKSKNAERYEAVLKAMKKVSAHDLKPDKLYGIRTVIKAHKTWLAHDGSKKSIYLRNKPLQDSVWFIINTSYGIKITTHEGTIGTENGKDIMLVKEEEGAELKLIPTDPNNNSLFKRYYIENTADMKRLSWDGNGDDMSIIFSKPGSNAVKFEFHKF